MAKLPTLARYGGTFTLGAVFGTAGTIAAYTIIRPHQIPDGLGPLVQGIGNVLLGFATLGAAFKGAQFARDTYVRWEERHLKERQAEVAGEAIVAAKNLAAAIRTVGRLHNRLVEQNDRQAAHELCNRMRKALIKPEPARVGRSWCATET